MVTRYDEKGKYFTNIIAKNKLFTYIQTPEYQIQGSVHVRADQRLKDEVNGEDQFIAVTDAQVYDHSGNLLYKCKFMLVNRNQMIWLIPKNEII